MNLLTGWSTTAEARFISRFLTVEKLNPFDFDSPIYQEPNMSTPQNSTQAAPASSGGLRAGTLGFPEVIGQSIANLSPTFTPSINVTAIAALAGAGT